MELMPIGVNTVTNETVEYKEECRICQKYDESVDIPFGYCDYICHECQDKLNQRQIEHDGMMERLEPILKILRRNYYSKPELKLLMQIIRYREWDY